MKVLVTGAAGFLGRHVVAALLARGHFVRVLVRPTVDLATCDWAPRVDTFRADLRFHDGLATAFDGIDVLLHLAAQVLGDDDSQFDGTAVTTERLLDAMSATKTRRLVLASSFSVYDWRAARGTLDETTALDSDLYLRGGYAIAKVWQERVARRISAEHGWGLTILRPGFIWGRGHADVPGASFALGPVNMVLGVGRRLPLTHVENCADCFAIATEHVHDGLRVCNTIDNDEITAWRFVGERLSRTGRGGIRVPLPFAAVSLLARAANLGRRLTFGRKGRLPSLLMPERLAIFRPLRFSNRELHRQLGWTPRLDFRAALDRTFDPQP